MSNILFYEHEVATLLHHFPEGVGRNENPATFRICEVLETSTRTITINSIISHGHIFLFVTNRL